MGEEPEPQMPDSQNSPIDTARAPVWMRVAFFVSLALNVLVVGAVAGALLAGDGPRGHPPPASLVRDLGLGPYLRALGPEDRTALRKSASAQREDLRNSRREMRKAFEQTLRVLRAEVLDEAQLRSLIRTQADVAERGRALGQRLLVERIKAMTVAERRGLAERLEQTVRRGGRRTHGAPDKRPDK